MIESTATANARGAHEMLAIRVLDFGLACRDERDATLTQQGQILGTPSYMSPELASGRSHLADRRTDIYSIGVILFQLLTGDLPEALHFRDFERTKITVEPTTQSRIRLKEEIKAKDEPITRAHGRVKLRG